MWWNKNTMPKISDEIIKIIKLYKEHHYWRLNLGCCSHLWSSFRTIVWIRLVHMKATTSKSKKWHEWRHPNHRVFLIINFSCNISINSTMWTDDHETIRMTEKYQCIHTDATSRHCNCKSRLFRSGDIWP